MWCANFLKIGTIPNAKKIGFIPNDFIRNIDFSGVFWAINYGYKVIHLLTMQGISTTTTINDNWCFKQIVQNSPYLISRQ